MIILKILAFAFLLAGFGMVFGAKNLVRKFNMDEKARCNFEHEMDEEELKQYKFNKAAVNTKMMGMLVALPGLILILIAFK